MQIYAHLFTWPTYCFIIHEYINITALNLIRLQYLFQTATHNLL